MVQSKKNLTIIQFPCFVIVSLASSPISKYAAIFKGSNLASDWLVFVYDDSRLLKHMGWKSVPLATRDVKLMD